MNVVKGEGREDSRQDEQLAHSNLQFFKGQQWSVTNYGLLLYGALIGLTQLGGGYAIRGSSLQWFPMIVGLAATLVLWNLETALRRARAAARNARAARGLNDGGRDERTVAVFLTVALASGSGLTSWAFGAGIWGLAEAFVALTGAPLGWYIGTRKGVLPMSSKSSVAKTSLQRNIGRALVQAQFSRLGRDVAHQKKTGDEAQHLLSPYEEQLPAKLVQYFGDLTNGMLGLVLDPPERRGIVLHLRELPEDWEERVDRTALEAFVIHLVSACEWFIDDVKGEERFVSFVSKYPTRAGVLGELRATRNCIVHNAGIVDERYLVTAHEHRRAQKGQPLPLDWEYAYERALSVLEFAQEVEA